MVKYYTESEWLRPLIGIGQTFVSKRLSIIIILALNSSDLLQIQHLPIQKLSNNPLISGET